MFWKVLIKKFFLWKKNLIKKLLISFKDIFHMMSTRKQKWQILGNYNELVVIDAIHVGYEWGISPYTVRGRVRVRWQNTEKKRIL